MNRHHAENRRYGILAKRQYKRLLANGTPRYYRCRFARHTIWRMLGGKMMCGYLMSGREGRGWIESQSKVRVMDYRCDSRGRFLHGRRARKVGTRGS